MATICDGGLGCETGRVIVTTRPVSGVTVWVKRLWDWLMTRMAKRRSRIDLSELTDDQLADIGVTAEEARREASQPFWR